MNASRAKNCNTNILALQSSSGISTKNNFKFILFLLMVMLTFFSSLLFGCKSRQFKTPDSAQEQKNVLIDEIRVTPKDFLLGLYEDHPIVQAVNSMTDDVLEGNRMTAKVPIEENGKVIEKEFTFTTPSRIKEKDS